MNDIILEPTPVPRIVKRLPNDSVQKLTRNAMEKSVEKNIREFENDKMIAKQNKFFADLTIELENTREYLQQGIDSAGLEREINNIIKWYQIAAEGVFKNKGSTQTSRNLAITHIILTEAAKRLDVRYEETNDYLENLNLHKQRLDSLLTDSSLLKIPSDSAAFASFFEKAVQAGNELAKMYENLKNTISIVQDQNARCQMVHNTLRIKLDEVEQYRRKLTRNAFRREFGNIWGPIGFARPFSQILDLSISKNLIVMGFYLRNHAGFLLFIALLTVGFALFLKYLKRTAEKRPQDTWNADSFQSLSYPWLISVFIMLNVCQFFFSNPPFLFYASWWIIASVLLSFLFWKKIHASLRQPWLLLISLFVLAVLLNSVLQTSRPERWAAMALALVILAAAVFSIKRLNRLEGNNRFLLIFTGLVIVLEILSIFFNAIGRYNFAKTTLTSGIFNLVVLILLLWTCRYIHEIIKVIAIVFSFGKENTVNKSADDSSNSLLPFPPLLNVLLLAGWFMLFMRNFYAFTIFTEPFRQFMEAERTLGAYTFSIQSIFNFFLIMFFATLLSRVVSFFASEASQDSGKSKKGVGSWLLLIRITIFSLALFLAFAAAGIAMDKIAIIFSALSVGIGFGLQTLVNNLVSGLIIAFEKPVNVGDAVDINGQSGIMKSIGFRSSVISTFDGSDMIIPNGDLLNAHLINWTLGDTKRRVEVLVGVAYGSDLEKVKSLLLDLLLKDNRILLAPPPTILIKDFGASSVDFRVLFWIDSENHLWSAVKSDVIAAIDATFKAEQIEIPFAQQDIRIRSVTPDILPKKE